MSSRPRSIRTLNQMIRPMPAREGLAPIIADMCMEQSDRAAAITGAAMLDGALEAAINTKFRKLSDPEFKDIFSADSPLGSFSAKIRIGYALRLFGPICRGELDAIREVRNAFAHTRQPISFQTPQVSHVCDRINLPERLLREKLEKRLPVKDNYVMACVFFMVWFDSIGRRDRLKDRPAWTPIIAE